MENSKSDKFIPSHKLNTAVLFLIFNRLDTTKKVFEAIREAKPPRLYIASDGPRKTRENENLIVKEVRDYVLGNIDWDCEVKTLLREENLGCGMAVSSAITWFFENEEMGIILEDDCLPSQSFFWFCEELLERYKDDSRIFHIGGTNPIEKSTTSNTFYFSKYNRIWGWATWKRSWRFFDLEMKNWPIVKKKRLHYNIFQKKEAIYWEKIWDQVYNKKIDTWDYQWFFNKVLNGLSVIPNVNLVSNIGFDKNATHTKEESWLSNLKRGEVSFPVKANEFYICDKKKDKKWSDIITKKGSLFIRFYKKYGKIK